LARAPGRVREPSWGVGEGEPVVEARLEECDGDPRIARLAERDYEGVVVLSERLQYGAGAAVIREAGREQHDVWVDVADHAAGVATGWKLADRGARKRVGDRRKQVGARLGGEEENAHRVARHVATVAGGAAVARNAPAISQS